MKIRFGLLAVVLAATGLITTVNAALPDPGMDIVPGRTALVITDPQNDFLSPKGVAWGVVGKSVTENRTVENIDSLSRLLRRTASRYSSHHTTTTRPITAGISRVRWKS